MGWAPSIVLHDYWENVKGLSQETCFRTSILLLCFAMIFAIEHCTQSVHSMFRTDYNIFLKISVYDEHVYVGMLVLCIRDFSILRIAMAS